MFASAQMCCERASLYYLIDYSGRIETRRGPALVCVNIVAARRFT